MKAEFEQPLPEKNIIITMKESEAKTLKGFISELSYSDLIKLNKFERNELNRIDSILAELLNSINKIIRKEN